MNTLTTKKRIVTIDVAANGYTVTPPYNGGMGHLTAPANADLYVFEHFTNLVEWLRNNLHNPHELTPGAQAQNKMLTIEEFLMRLPPDIRDAALRNTSAKKLFEVPATQTLARAVHMAFTWHKTIEGDDFWMNVYNAARDGTPYPALPAQAQDAKGGVS